jgi:hypothetical protein
MPDSSGRTNGKARSPVHREARDYVESKVTSGQNDVIKHLTVVASILLLPTFVVGLCGQNVNSPGLGFRYGYAWPWELIALMTCRSALYSGGGSRLSFWAREGTDGLRPGDRQLGIYAGFAVTPSGCRSGADRLLPEPVCTTSPATAGHRAVAPATVFLRGELRSLADA